MFFDKKVPWKVKVPWIWILYSASSIIFSLQIYFPQFHLISPIVVVEYRCRGDKQENCLKNSDFQIPGKSKRQNRKTIFTSMTDMPSHVTKREPPASPISQSILFLTFIICKYSLLARRNKRVASKMNELQLWPPGAVTSQAILSQLPL